MQTRKLSVKAFQGLMLAESLRVSFIIHTLALRWSHAGDLLVLRASIILFKHGAVVSATKVEAGVNMTLGSHARSTRRNTTLGHHPKSTGTIIDFVCPLPQS